MEKIAVKPSSYRSISIEVESFRRLLESHDDNLFIDDYCDIVGIYDLLMGLVPSSFKFDCVPLNHWSNQSIEGKTKCDGSILIREDVYENACVNESRD